MCNVIKISLILKKFQFRIFLISMIFEKLSSHVFLPRTKLEKKTKIKNLFTNVRVKMKINNLISSFVSGEHNFQNRIVQRK